MTIGHSLDLITDKRVGRSNIKISTKSNYYQQIYLNINIHIIYQIIAL